MDSRAFDLTTRQHEILERVARGLTNVEIAAELHITVRTVQAHLATVYRKMGVSNRREAANSAYPSGMP